MTRIVNRCRDIERIVGAGSDVPKGTDVVRQGVRGRGVAMAAERVGGQQRDDSRNIRFPRLANEQFRHLSVHAACSLWPVT